MGHHEIIGDDMQAVILSLAPGDVVRAEAGAMMFMTESIDMDATMEGGLLGGLTGRRRSGPRSPRPFRRSLRRAASRRNSAAFGKIEFCQGGRDRHHDIT